TRVMYDTGSVVGKYPPLDEFGVGIMRFQDDHIGIIEASIVDRASPCSITVHGTDGYASLTTDGLIVQGTAAERIPRTGHPPLSLSPGNGLAPFLDALCGRDVELVTPTDAARIIAVMDAFTKSKHDG